MRYYIYKMKQDGHTQSMCKQIADQLRKNGVAICADRQASKRFLWNVHDARKQGYLFASNDRRRTFINVNPDFIVKKVNDKAIRFVPKKQQY